jgi:ligand-binding sensor domain-containing protein
MINRCLILFCLLAGSTARGLTQILPHLVGKLTVEEGLSSNIITDLVQDDNGFLWIATPDGLNRFDGTDIVQYYHRGGTNSLAHNYIYCLQQLPGNYLAIGTQGGLSFYNGNTDSFQNFYYRQNNSLDAYNNTIVGLTTDALGNLWVTSKNCIFVFDRQRQLRHTISSPFTKAFATKERLSFVEKIWPLSNGDMILYMFDGWKRWSNSTHTLTAFSNFPFLQHQPASGSPFARLFKVFGSYFLCMVPGTDSLVLFDEEGREKSSCYFPYNKYPYVSWSQQAIQVDSGGIVLLFHNFGMASVPVHWEKGEPILSPLSPFLFPADEYKTAIRDHQGNWWLATTREGLQKVSPSAPGFSGTTLIDLHSHTRARYETMSCSRYGRRLWIATYGDGFFESDLVSGQQTQHRFTGTGNDTWSNFIWNVRQVNTDTLWVGTQNGLFWYNPSSGKNGRLPDRNGKPAILDSVPITTQFTDSHGITWMGLGMAKGLCSFDNNLRTFTYYPGNSAQGYPLRYPTNISEDGTGGLWFVSDASNDLLYLDRPSHRFRIFTLPSSTQRQIGNLVGICNEGDSALWLGSLTCGLLKFNHRTNSLTIYSHEKGLNNSRIGSIYEDTKKRLWLVTEGGLTCFDQHTETFINYSGHNGLPVPFPTADFFYDPQDHRLYTGGHGEFFSFYPDSIALRQTPHRTLITAMQVNGQPCWPDPTRTISLNAQQNDITLRYAAVNLDDGPAIRYAYRLTGIDTGWIMAGKQRQINFSHLAPGSYTFQVRAAGSNGIWNPQTAGVSFQIQPPFTRTATFYTLLWLITAAIAFIFYRYRTRQLNRTRQIRSEISRNLHDEVGANLTNISLSSLLAQRQLHDANAVSQLLDRIYQDSQLVSESMRDIVWSINPDIDTLGDALPRMLHYASQLLEARSIELRAAIDPEVEDLKLSMKQRRDVYLIFKEAINNMARHSNATHASIRFQSSGDTLTMRIADDGSGFGIPSPDLHNGLKNMHERARQHRWTLEVRSRPQSAAGGVIGSGLPAGGNAGGNDGGNAGGNDGGNDGGAGEMEREGTIITLNANLA